MLAEEERFPAVKEMTDLGRAYHRSWIKRVFQAHLASLPAADRERRHGQLVIATDLLTWKLLRSDGGMSRPKAEATVLEMLATLTGGT